MTMSIDRISIAPTKYPLENWTERSECTTVGLQVLCANSND